MLYTVKQLSEIANVTIKTLHYYHRIGLLAPAEISAAGYRLYGMKELERLQQILFYRELDFPLKKIKKLLDSEPDRLAILTEQKRLLLARVERTERLLQTLNDSITAAAKGERMDQIAMFKGFKSEEEWRGALAEHNDHVMKTYGYDLKNQPINLQEMNESAHEAQQFLFGMRDALLMHAPCDDERVKDLLAEHLRFLNDHGHETTPTDFAALTRFFLKDDFHRGMLEGIETGLSYYLCLAAESYADR
ncbi:MerR family transcriptional regulator [Camelliibacillus cellulosilyticus]|uniref:MerR family transcriptional regulator n=1 Tax=Camelliibacillus cellulosilyticus TaxID=2174486 RepID=A0ABV9GHI0_9BACL